MRLKRAACASESSQSAAIARACIATWMGGRKGWQKDRPVEREVTIADLAAEFLARESDSAETGNSVVAVPTPHGSARPLPSASTKSSRAGAKTAAAAASASTSG